MAKKNKTPWPTRAVMNQIYEQHLWGGKAYDFYSGFGSHDPTIVEPYLEAIKAFIKSHINTLEVCDLGCGDFNIGKHLVKHTKKYIAIDIVESLINRNKKLFHNKNLEFYCLDIAKDEIPLADCVILRQVLQHLSNSEIKYVVEKLVNFKYIILTEHLPIGVFTPNQDIISGQGIRLKLNSGVNLLEPPFNFKIKDEKQLHEHILEEKSGRIVTTLYQTF
ncbi:class I SAM-dependent methyltransferase [Algibacter luteus]|uniref:class I SAM-dependent methyltransferase n=1 Tax=Algibacter luteus TaxID=1178825 RepID=UPI002597DC72|nr:class I SAM-dependent methyltransferase [Algibacter luteus]WJJ96726.1 class I SAM-dependent methyltransferase [Algibacter luteus]